jgi:hypothetical protein
MDTAPPSRMKLQMARAFGPDSRGKQRRARFDPSQSHQMAAVPSKAPGARNETRPHAFVMAPLNAKRRNAL